MLNDEKTAIHTMEVKPITEVTPGEMVSSVKQAVDELMKAEPTACLFLTRQGNGLGIAAVGTDEELKKFLMEGIEHLTKLLIKIHKERKELKTPTDPMLVN